MKSADDYQGKMSGLPAGFPPGQPMMGGFPMGVMGPGGVPGFMPGRGPIPAVSKPNPYAIVETKTRGDDSAVEVSFKYPKSKIFVGGLDFKLTVEELKQHFQQYGEVVDACILKDVYTG